MKTTRWPRKMWRGDRDVLSPFKIAVLEAEKHLGDGDEAAARRVMLDALERRTP